MRRRIVGYQYSGTICSYVKMFNEGSLDEDNFLDFLNFKEIFFM